MPIPSPNAPPDEEGPSVASPSASRSSPLTPSLDEPAGVTLARLVVLLVASITALRLAHMTAVTAWAILASVSVWSLAACRHWSTAVAGAGIGWLLGTGFLIHRNGELSFDQDDRGRLIVLGIAALTAVLVSAGGHHLDARRPSARDTGQ